MQKQNLLLSVFVSVFLGGGLCSGMPLYKDAQAPVDKRVADLLPRMTLQEKIFQLGTYYPNANVRLGIPCMTVGEVLHGVMAPEATVFPQCIGLGASFDCELVERMGHVVAKEARALGIHHVYSPYLSVVRDPRWGRTDEQYGEDPYLVSRMGVAYIRGLQGTGKQFLDRDHVLATAKVLVADGQPDGGRNGAAFDVSERLLREIFLPPFEAAVREANVQSVMPAHHLLNGIPCHANKWLIDDVLRGEYGFDGFVVSDNGDVGLSHGYPHVALSVARDMVEATRMSLEAGVDAELVWNCPYRRRCYGGVLFEAVRNGAIPEALVDRAVARVLTAKFRLGLFDDDEPVNPENDLAIQSGLLKEKDEKAFLANPFAYAEMMMKGLEQSSDVFQIKRRVRKNVKAVLNNPAHNELALEAARKSIVLLKNSAGLLPLDKTKLKTIAVIGPNADAMVFGGYSNRQPRYNITVLEGIRRYVGPSVKVLYEKGCDFDNIRRSEAGIPAAVAAARKSDVAILVIGGNNITCRENQDRDDLELTGAQMPLVKAVAATGTPVVVVLLHGRPLTINWIVENISAIVDGWYLGQEGGRAMAEVLFGEVNPGGKLPITYPRSVGQVPCPYNHLPTGRPFNYYQTSHEPLFPFGYGLSYTTFSISPPRVSPPRIKPHQTATVTTTVTNTGTRTGDEVVQLYIRDEYSSVARPVKELKGFRRITLRPGEKREVRFELGPEALRFWKHDRWVVEPGFFKVMVGPNSRDLKSTRLEVVE